jgi:hypothetical protein
LPQPIDDMLLLNYIALWALGKPVPPPLSW